MVCLEKSSTALLSMLSPWYALANSSAAQVAARLLAWGDALQEQQQRAMPLVSRG